MTHPARTQPDSIWKIGYAPSGADFIDIDKKTTVAVNGDLGGTWLPLIPLTIAGDGVEIAGPWQVSGGQANVTGQITFDEGSADDYFGFDAGHPETSIVVYQSLFEAYSDYPEAIYSNLSSPSSNAFQPVDGYNGIISTKIGTKFIVPFRCRNGGRCTQVIFSWRVGLSHVALPSLLPRFSVFAVDVLGNIFPLRAPDATTDAAGYQIDDLFADGPPSAYYAAGGPQTFTYVCNQNNVIDKSKYSYFVGIVDEDGTGALAGNAFLSLNSSFDLITLLDSRG